MFVPLFTSQTNKRIKWQKYLVFQTKFEIISKFFFFLTPPLKLNIFFAVTLPWVILLNPMNATSFTSLVRLNVNFTFISLQS